ncbi:LOW QUALITY PROTEIN: G-type lectin S-receptor-like serine/threonine-protein kinase LECRK2 [Olea europaea var. sylvestris]|uniref:LOW QUALITY PROTEIN: G-type lectin S-receptor-like serine/threonine-protein kinase LECRK2 n=1 Tax=Olea europaea var. sylvestris TaxID=158386 RepID=UPI000C1CEED2|nr:LOW QUALITY PROTEIN: G-type lectin S-receptor-like serine/threonine-protein kinase LECRK2 [Olea europaea var. sylvestris]
MFFIIFLLPLGTSSQNDGTVNVGISLPATERSNPWLSPSGDFAFGFQKLQDNDQFLLSIWYNKIPAKTIVWYPKDTSPVSRGSTVEIDTQNGLVLRDPQGSRLWRTENIVDSVSGGFMNDTGNFVISRRDSTGIWESFKNPSDTMLPTQIIEINGKLVSRKSETNFSRGRFYLDMLNNGNLVLNTRSVSRNLGFDDEYYNSQTSDLANVSNSGYQVIFSERGSIQVLRTNGERKALTTERSIPTTSDHYHRATLDFDGVFRQYYHPKSFSGNPGWTAAEYWPENICVSIKGDRGSGACGYNSICRLQNGTPICRCPQGYSLADPESPDKPKKDRETLILVGSVLLGSSVFINFMLVGAACFGFILIYNNKITNFRRVHNAAGLNLQCFTYKELAQATNGFKEELGRGSFGIVYKGVMPMGSITTIAVKKLDRVAQDTEKEFRTEVNVIGQTHHKNLVRLLGFCDEGPHRLLVYEYMNNGTVASFLFGDLKPNWNQRTQIAMGIAKGLAYLHEECSTQIIHCDIKPQNILLDEYYNARISDFGLAKLLMVNQSRTLTNIRGTKGYVAPEWFRNTKVTVKVDVYSFGILLLEIITCRRSVVDLEFGEGENPILADWVWDCFQEGRLDNLVVDDTEALNDKKGLERFVMVGIWCIQEDSSLRPTMRKACQMLEGILEVKFPPCPSPFTSTDLSI